VKAGTSVPTDVAIRCEVDRRTVHRWLVRYAAEGLQDRQLAGKCAKEFFRKSFETM
jgi:hypothetical protein